MIKGFRPITRADMNKGIMPDGVPPTLAQIKQGARYNGKPYTVHESQLMKKYRTNDLRIAKDIEKEERKLKIKKGKDKLSEFL